MWWSAAPQGLKEIYHYLASGAVKGGAGPPPACSSRSSARTPCGSWRRNRRSLPGCGVSPKRARAISEAFRKQMGMRRLLEFLSEHQLPMELSSRLFRAYGDVALEVVRSNPYVLAAGEFGVDFSPGGRPGPLSGCGGGRSQRLEAKPAV